jgi:starch-binding outer membrane protein, SusD/RagB family
MKKISIILSLLTLVTVSCNKLLDVQPTDAISSSQAIKDRSGVENAITGAYNALHSTGIYGRYQVIVEDLAADNLVWTGTTQDYSQIANHTIPADNGIIEGMWSASYDCINRVNNVLSKISGIEMSTDDRNMFTGDGLFMRALCHFNLLCSFGGIPIKTQPTLDLSNINQARNTVPQVYEQIIADLQQAEALLPATRTLGYASSFSATALLARVYLTQFQQNNDPALATLAIERAGKVISEGGFTLAPDYASLFSGNTTESVFEIVSDVQNRTLLAQYFYPRSLLGRYEVSPPAAFVQTFKLTDTARFLPSIAFDSTKLAFGYKYRDVTAGTDRIYVLRLAEMYLIRAEARAYSNGSIEEIRNDVNVIRARAGLTPTTSTDYNELKMVIENERRHEFAFESQRWSDLVRTKRATVILGIDPNYTLFPIPLSELQTNTLMTQNPGY